MRSCDDEVVPVAGDPLPGLSAGTRTRLLAVHLGVERIAQAQFDAGAELVPQAGSDVGPAPGGDEQVNAVGQTLGGYGGDGHPSSAKSSRTTA